MLCAQSGLSLQWTEYGTVGPPVRHCISPRCKVRNCNTASSEQLCLIGKVEPSGQNR